MQNNSYLRVSYILQSAGLVDYSKANSYDMEFAQSRGEAVHLASALYDQNNLKEDTLDPRIRPYLDAWVRCVKDLKIVIESIEQEVISNKYHYRGTPDRVVTINGDKGILDIKTTAKLMPATAIQLAAYLHAYCESNPTKRATKRYAILLKENGSYELAPKDFFKAGDFNIFLSALNITNWKKEMRLL